MSDSERNWFSGRVQLRLTSPQSSELVIIAATEMKEISGARKTSASETLLLSVTDQILAFYLDSMENNKHIGLQTWLITVSAYYSLPFCMA